MYILGGVGGRQAVKVAGQHVAPLGVVWPLGKGSSQPLPLRLRSRGNVPSSILRDAALSPRAYQPRAREPGASLPPRTGTQGRLSGHLALAGGR